MNAGGRVLASGGSYSSLEASFAAVKHHAARFDEAPVKINLREAAVPTIMPQVPVAQRDTKIADIDRERTRRGARRNGALANIAVLLPAAIAASAPPDWSHVR